jgi:DNA polymerase-3 subunit epsilon
MIVEHYGKLIFIDLETTGPNHVTDFITEIGIVEVSAAGVTRWSSLVNPGVSIPPFIQQLTGITDAMVRDAPTFESLAEEVLDRVQGGLFIAHNARFDYGFLRNAFKRLDYALRCDVLCTVKLSRKLFPSEAHHNLDALTARHHLSAGSRHRALSDADLLWQFWRTLDASIPPETLHDAIRGLLQRPSIPTHLAPEQLDDIPDTPGVYLFYGEHDVPLYVGKSIHLRQRVLSHFNADHSSYKEMRLSRQVRRVDWRETAGEVGALLLEAQLIKEMQPVHNFALRRQRDLCAWQLRPTAAGYLEPALVNASELDFGNADRLYGLFSTRGKAETALRSLADSHQLCLALLGLEARSHADRPCFAHQLRRCRGACAGKEPMEQHQQRLENALAALKVRTWPYAGVVGLVENGVDGRRDVHVVNNWCCLGTAQSEAEMRQLLEEAPPRPAFDVDTYKILLRALANGKVGVRELGPVEPAQPAQPIQPAPA